MEITDKCNASCAQCGRNKLGGAVNPYLKNTEISLEHFKKMVPPSQARELKRLYMCGNFGDPIVATDTLEVFKYLRSENPEISLGMNTNGSARDRSWWHQLGEVFAPKGAIKFGLDGLEDTHSIYRRKTSFSKIIDNAQAFIEGGGEAHWEYIVFRHNEHQIEAAQKLSKEIGFKKFTIKKTGRFFSNTKIQTNEHQEVWKDNGEIDYIIEKPLNSEFQNRSLQKEQELIQRYGSMLEYLDQTQVQCKVIDESSLYISADGYAFPCCWTANQLYLWYMPEKSGQIWKLLRDCGGVDTINASKHTLQDIMAGEFFRKIKESWSCQSLEQGKLKVCAKTCGAMFDQFKDQYK